MPDEKIYTYLKENNLVPNDSVQYEKPDISPSPLIDQKTTTPPAPKEKGFLEKVGERISGAVENVKGLGKEMYQETLDIGERQLTGKQGVGESLLQLGGAGAKFATGLVLGEPLKIIGGILGDVAPDFIKKGASEAGLAILKTPLGQEGLKAVSGGLKAYEGWKTKNPGVANDLEAVLNIGSIFVGGKAAKEAGSLVKEGAIAGEEALQAGKEAAAKGLGTIAEKAAQKEAGKIPGIVEEGISKGIKPSVAGKATEGDVRNYFEKARDAVKSIITNKEKLKFADEAGNIETGRLPETLSEFSQSVDTTKKEIFRQYDELAKKAGQKGAKVDLKSIAGELKAVTDNPVLADNAPDAVQYAKTRMAALSKRKVYTTEQAQEAIAIYNKSLDAFYKNPNYDNASKAAIDAMIANKLRVGLDGVIENSVGEGYQGLKNTYGALKTIESDVTKAALREAKRAPKGLIDYADIASGAELVRAIATLNPADLATSAAIKGFKEYIKLKNNPSRIVKNMFSDVEKAMSGEGGKIGKGARALKGVLEGGSAAPEMTTIGVGVGAGAGAEAANQNK